MKQVLATRNLGKVRELTEMLSDCRGLEVLSLVDFPDAPEVVEDGKTYEENAIKKATQIAEYTGLPTLADDSGLEVDALSGAPGIHSARYAGERASDAERIQKLLETLKDVPEPQRTARFQCTVAIVEPERQSRVAVGVCEGRIIREPRGAHGFGYDPVFVPLGYAQTFAELGDEVKNRISHRAKAFAKVKELLSDG
jgi:XTP/dITP diphosphohydrolase